MLIDKVNSPLTVCHKSTLQCRHKLLQLTEASVREKLDRTCINSKMHFQNFNLNMSCSSRLLRSGTRVSSTPMSRNEEQFIMKLMLYLQGSVRDMADFDGSNGDKVDMVVTPPTQQAENQRSLSVC